jgi:DNA polymerase-3 subunit beta
MKLTVSRGDLWRGIDTVLDAVPSKPALPILSNMLLRAEDDVLFLAATNMDLSMRTRIPATITESGSITVPARTFAEIVREWPQEGLSIEVQGDRLSLSGVQGAADSREGTYTLPGVPPDEFPEMPMLVEGLNLQNVDGRLLSSMINKTAFAVSRDETRPVLNGVLWSIDAEGMEMVATDGHRLARFRRTQDLTEDVGRATAEVILPPQVCNLLTKVLGSQHGQVHATVGESQVLFDLGETHLLSRLIEGPYVDYRQVIPRQNDKVMRVSCGDLLPAVRRVSILSSSYTHQIRVGLTANRLELSAASQEIGGEAREAIAAAYDHEPMEMAYNAVYLMEILRKIDAPEISFRLSNAVTAALLRPAEETEGEDYFCLLMPLRLGN